MGKIVPKECYEQFGKDLDGCSRQQLGGCGGCKCLVDEKAPCGLPDCELCKDYPCFEYFGPQQN